ncbi:MAG TPA: H-X9-DG-CTERM domain-containing protein, partial [Verrucomicrobiae bacterium]
SPPEAERGTTRPGCSLSPANPRIGGEGRAEEAHAIRFTRSKGGVSFASAGLRPGSYTGFTLIELAVVLVLVSLIALVLTPALARTRPVNNATQCLNNYRQLGMAWRMYGEDNNGRLAYNHDGGNVGKAPGSENWAGGWMDFSSSSDNTNTALLINHERYPYSAFFGSYLASYRPFKCPADKLTVNIAGQRLPRVRSVSMNSRVGEGGRSWTTPSAYRLYPNLRGVFPPAPAQLFVLLDEHEASINDSVFFVDPDTQWRLIDFPASYHNGGAGFAFADGHSEIHRWHDGRTMPVLSPGQLLPLNGPMPGSVDIQWLQQHVAARN